MRRSLKRLTDYYNFTKNTNRVSSSSRYCSVSSSYKFRNSTPVLQQLSRCIHIHIGGGENPKSISYKVEEANARSDSDPAILKANCTKKEVVEEELTSIKKGDIVNLYDLIFTKNRDYLIRCNDGQRVKSQQLAGKVVVIYLVNMKDISFFERRDIIYLMNIHNELRADNCLEVVIVDVSLSGEISPAPSLKKHEKQFKDKISSMPWTTIPLSDITSRKYLKQRFGHQGVVYCGRSFVIDPTGIVLQSEASSTIFQKFGALGYPFSDERINYLKSEDNKVAMYPSLKALLASPQHDYLISNKGDKVPIHTLEDKVVALYFYEEGFTDKNITVELKKAYKKLAKNNKKFEVVLIYLYDGPNTGYETNEDSFWKTFKTMPWLALPFRDSIYKKLDRIFHYPWVFNEPEYALIIIGPHMEFIEPFGIFILMNFKIPAFPFSREKVAKLLAEEAKELKLEMLWDPESVFGEKYGFEVQYSQLVGKRVIIIFESFFDHDWDFLETLKEKYNQLKGTTDEFEVIHILQESYSNESKVYHVANLPWFVQPAGAHLIYKSNMFNFYQRHVFLYYGGCSLIAFDRDGRVVRRTIFPTVEDLDFPFYDGDLEKEALSQLVWGFQWDRLHYIHPGRIYSYKKSYDEVFKYYDSHGLYYPEYEHLRNM